MKYYETRLNPVNICHTRNLYTGKEGVYTVVFERKKCNTVEPLFMTSLGKSSPFPLAIPSNEFKPFRFGHRKKILF